MNACALFYFKHHKDGNVLRARAQTQKHSETDTIKDEENRPAGNKVGSTRLSPDPQTHEINEGDEDKVSGERVWEGVLER